MKKRINFWGRKNERTDKDSFVSIEDPTSSITANCDKIVNGISKAVITLANEPSLAYFRIQEHVRKAAPVLIEERMKVLDLQPSLQGSSFDLDYAINSINNCTRSAAHLNRLNELLKSSLFTKLQLDYAEKYSTDVEVGVDLVATLGLVRPQSPDPSSEPKVERPPLITLTGAVPSMSINQFYTPEQSKVNFSTNSGFPISTPTLDVRSRIGSIQFKRALHTRSADVSSMVEPSLSTYGSGPISVSEAHSSSQSTEEQPVETGVDAATGV